MHKRSEKAGLPPGALVRISDLETAPTRMRLLRYDAGILKDQPVGNIDTALAAPDLAVNWLDVTGLADVEAIAQVGRHYGLHPLTVEDVLNTEQRPKLESYGSYLFFDLKTLIYNPDAATLLDQQISVILGDNFVLSFQEQPTSFFEMLRQRAAHNGGLMREAGADYLAYALTDLIVDNYFKIIEEINDQVETLGDRMLGCPTPEDLQTAHRLQREVRLLRKFVWPLREVIGGLMQEGTPFISPQTRLYLRDVHDHVIYILEEIDYFTSTLKDQISLYLSLGSHRLNRIMQVLTVITVIFMPLTFLAGLYGMNFAYMPELNWRYGYHVLLAVMALIGVTMYRYFKRRRWIDV